jgi:putative transposase
MVSSNDLETGEVSMVSWSLMQILTFFLDIFTILGVTNCDKDLEIIVLHQQVRILQRKVKSPPVISGPERMILAILTDRLYQSTRDACLRLDQVMMVFKPDTVLGWHRELVRRKWTFKRKGKPGRPVISSELETLIVRLANENLRWGYDKIWGELLKLGYRISASSVRNILKQQRIAASAERSSGSWCNFPGYYKGQIQACDFFTVENFWLKTIYVLFLFELGTRRVHLAGWTTNPNAIWVTQQARQLDWYLKDDPQDMAYLIHDNDKKSSSSFDNVFILKGSRLYIRHFELPGRMPSLNGGCAQFMRSAWIIS